jgi:SAM-dependent methyltransferase
VEIKNLTFEEWDVPDLKFDAVLAATSWHWLSPETAYAKAYEAMKNKGSLILFWNTPPQPSYETYLILEDIYQNIAPDIPLYARYQSVEYHQETFEQFSKDILASGYFHQLVYENVNHEITYSITDYLDLLSTLSVYIALKSEQREFLTIHLMCSEHNATILSILTNHLPRKATAERVHPRRRFVKKNCLALSTKCNGKTQLPLHSAA